MFIHWHVDIWRWLPTNRYDYTLPKNILFSDGWTMDDLIYRWNENSPVQMVANLSLPGGFKLDNFGSVSCDVITATGKLDHFK